MDQKMNTRVFQLAILVLVAGQPLPGGCQGTFQNLDFESAFNLPTPNPASSAVFVPFTNALPGWVGYVGTNIQSQAMYNGISLGGALVSLVTSNTSISAIGVLDGNYTVTLDTGEYGPPLPTWPVAIAQIGALPEDAKSVLFFGAGQLAGNLIVTFEGQIVPYYELEAGPNYELYGGDISQFAGMTGELRFTEQPNTSPLVIAYLDDISFSPEAIPEPDCGYLAAVGVVVFGWWRRRGRRAKFCVLS